MKSTVAAALGVLLVAGPLLASSDASAHARHRMRRMSHARSGDGSSIVSVGSDVRISGSGEVIVPPTAIIAVHKLPPTLPPNPGPGKPVAPATPPAQP